MPNNPASLELGFVAPEIPSLTTIVFLRLPDDVFNRSSDPTYRALASRLSHKIVATCRVNSIDDDASLLPSLARSCRPRRPRAPLDRDRGLAHGSALTSPRERIVREPHYFAVALRHRDEPICVIPRVPLLPPIREHLRRARPVEVRLILHAPDSSSTPPSPYRCGSGSPSIAWTMFPVASGLRHLIAPSGSCAATSREQRKSITDGVQHRQPRAHSSPSLLTAGRSSGPNRSKRPPRRHSEHAPRGRERLPLRHPLRLPPDELRPPRPPLNERAARGKVASRAYLGYSPASSRYARTSVRRAARWRSPLLGADQATRLPGIPLAIHAPFYHQTRKGISCNRHALNAAAKPAH